MKNYKEQRCPDSGSPSIKNRRRIKSATVQGCSKIPHSSGKANGFSSNGNGLPLFSKRLITLWDMREYPAHKIVHVLARLGQANAHVVHHRAMGGDWPSKEREKLHFSLLEAVPWLEELELGPARVLCMDLAMGVKGDWNVSHVEAKVDSLRRVLEAELQQRKLFAISPEYLGFYDNNHLAGEKFKDNWPQANGEMREAGNCLALDRFTACACHLMRATEYALRSVENALNIPASPRDTWGPILGRIEEKQGRGERQSAGLPNHPAVAPSTEWQSNPKFFGDCLTFMRGVKSSCRDEVFHINSTYDQQGADKLMRSVRSFLETVSEQLNEIR